MTDPLREATEALREFGDSGSAASMTRARVLASVRRTKRASRRRSLLALPLAAILVGSLAAAATGGYLPAPIQRWLSARSTLSSEKAERRDGRSSIARAPALAVPADAGGGSGERPEPATTSQPLLDDSSRPAQQRQAVDINSGLANEPPPYVHEAPNQRAVVDEKPMTEEEYERYRLAHETHFVKKDPAAALAAWTEYLAHSPSGRLAVEARYNRALCLLKLGRNQEAKAALRPFTQGSYGAYRQKEAQRLIAQLDSDAGR